MRRRTRALRELHPAEMSFEHRMQCLRDLKALGYQTGCGFMVGSPHQTARCLARDMRFIEELDPENGGNRSVYSAA